MRPLVLDRWRCPVAMVRPPNPYVNASGNEGIGFTSYEKHVSQPFAKQRGSGGEGKQNRAMSLAIGHIESFQEASGL